MSGTISRRLQCAQISPDTDTILQDQGALSFGSLLLKVDPEPCFSACPPRPRHSRRDGGGAERVSAEKQKRGQVHFFLENGVGKRGPVHFQ